MMKKLKKHSTAYCAFTLAEVLITLIIIGIVAVLTLPGLIQNYKKIEVETKLKRFYVMANQAITLSEIENGPKLFWDFDSEACVADAYGEDCIMPFWEKYLKKYFKYTKAEYVPQVGSENGHMMVYMADGSLLRIGYRAKNYTYYINEKSYHNQILSAHVPYGKSAFSFAFYPTVKDMYPEHAGNYYHNNGITPYIDAHWDGTREWLFSDVVNYTALIYFNGWKIPDDYPIKF